jgi:predicted nucleic acid-binding protein
MSSKSAVVIEPTTRHPPLLSGLLAGSGTAGNLVTDAHLAALALEHNATVVSFDRDFGVVFAGLTVGTISPPPALR